MHSDQDDGTTNKKKIEKTDTVPDVTVRVENTDAGVDKTEIKDPKPRIVLTFRSEKSGAKNSNMKIVSTEEKHEEVSPRRSNRNRNMRSESDEDNETLCSKKELNISQSVSENDEASDSSLATPKRSTRRRSKEFSENVLANAIARKEKSYNETLPGPTQRLSRRIKPTAKILANEELRIGLESQNNARLGIQTEKSTEEGVKTRRGAHPKSYEVDTTIVEKKATKRHRPMQDGKEEKTEGEESTASDMKVKHLCKLGLKAINNDDDQVQEKENRSDDDEDNDPREGVEDEEIDDDTEVISKLLEADEDSSDEEFFCAVGGNPGTERPRRSTRLCSSYGMNDSDQSSMSMGDDESKARPRRSSRLRFSCSDFYDRDGTGPEKGDESAIPLDQYPVVATCNCETSSNLYAEPDELTEPVFCQAIETVDGVRVGCSHGAARADGELLPLRRAGPRAPYVLTCRLHAAQLDRHMCCSACGLFCTQGIFYQCSLGHLFHMECAIVGSVELSGDVKQTTGCPHCGVHSVQWQPANTECSRVKIEMHCNEKRVFLPEQREQSIPAYLSFSALEKTVKDQHPLIPEDLLPSPPIDLKDLCKETEILDEAERISKLEQLCEAIVAAETAEQLIPKIAAVKGKGLDSAIGVAASYGHATAVYLLHFAGAKLDTVYIDQRTPLLTAITALLDNNVTKNEEREASQEEKTEAMEIDDKDAKQLEKNEHAEKNSTTEKKPSDDDYIKVIRYLLAAGCDVNFQGRNGMTALHISAELGAEEICALLLDEGHAAVDSRDHGGWTPLVWAADNSHSNVVRLLLEHGADVTATDNEGNSVVHWCALHGDAHLLGLLLHAAPQTLAATNAVANTPLHVAARHGHYACVVTLLARGARTDVENAAGALPVEASSGQCQAVISLNMQMALAVSKKPTRCRLLCNDISNGREVFPVPCVNEIDDAPPPDDFTYVTSHLTPRSITIDTSINSLQGCVCRGGECASAGGGCACSTLSVRAWYRGGRLPRDFPYHDPPMLFECNQTCRCDMRACGNCVVTRVQRAGSVNARVQVFRTERRGWALRTLEPLSYGTPVALYCGELLRHAEADARQNDHYMFALDVKQDLLEDCSEKEQLCVDAAVYGSAARFINHSCWPNLAPVRVFTDSRDLRVPVVALFARRDIAASEELTFDYGDKFWTVKSKWMKCECESVNCRYPTKTTDE